MISDKR
jgi:hypothetical protein